MIQCCMWFLTLPPHTCFRLGTTEWLLVYTWMSTCKPQGSCSNRQACYPCIALTLVCIFLQQDGHTLTSFGHKAVTTCQLDFKMYIRLWYLEPMTQTESECKTELKVWVSARWSLYDKMIESILSLTYYFVSETNTLSCMTKKISGSSCWCWSPLLIAQMIDSVFPFFSAKSVCISKTKSCSSVGNLS